MLTESSPMTILRRSRSGGIRSSLATRGVSALAAVLVFLGALTGAAVFADAATFSAALAALPLPPLAFVSLAATGVVSVFAAFVALARGAFFWLTAAVLADPISMIVAPAGFASAAAASSLLSDCAAASWLFAMTRLCRMLV